MLNTYPDPCIQICITIQIRIRQQGHKCTQSSCHLALQNQNHSFPNFQQVSHHLTTDPCTTFADLFLHCVPLSCHLALYSIFMHLVKEFFILEVHGSGLSGHSGQDEIIEEVERQVNWPCITKDVSKIISKCRICQLAKHCTQNTNLYTPLHPRLALAAC